MTRGIRCAHRIVQVAVPTGKHFSTLCGDLEGADKSWCELSLNVETLGSLKRSYSQVYMVSDLEVYLSATSVSIALLPRLGGLQSLSD